MYADIYLIIAAIAAVILLLASFCYQMHQIDVYMKQHHITTMKGARTRMNMK